MRRTNRNTANCSTLCRAVRPALLFLAAALAGVLLARAPALSQEDTAVPGEAAGEEVLSTPTRYQAEGEDLSFLSVQSRPEGARVFVDGEEKGTTPVYVRGLEEGSHEVILYLSGHGAYRQVVEGRGGRIFVDLEAEQGLGIGFVTVTTDPADVRVQVDGKEVGLTPLEIPVEAGRHNLHFSRVGFKDADVAVEVEPEGVQTVEVRLEPREGALLVISSPVGAEVFLDGNPVGAVWEPLRVADVPPGRHAVRLEKEGYRSWVREDVQVRSGETATVLAALLPERDYSWVRLHTQPAGARVWLDGEELGVAGADGLGFRAGKGAHRLRLALDPAAQPGYEPLELTVNFTQDEVDYSAAPLQLPPVDENFTQAMTLIERGQKEEALGFLERVAPEHPSYAEARLTIVEVLQDLRRTREIPGELEALVARPDLNGNPVLNTALGYWAIAAARDVPDDEAVPLLQAALDALDRAVRTADLFPPRERDGLLLKVHYYAGLASQVLFDLTGDKKYVKKGAQAWEVFFARLESAPNALEGRWVEKAREHRRTVEFLAKKLGG